MPFPRSDFRLIRNVAHLVLQWCMNSTGSRHPRWANMTIVESPSVRKAQLIRVPIHHLPEHTLGRLGLQHLHVEAAGLEAELEYAAGHAVGRDLLVH